MSELSASYQLPDSDADLLAQCDVHVFRGHGPGGQSVNTADSAVRLVHRPTGITVTCRRERSQYRNKRECLRRLRGRIEESLREEKPRVATRPTRSSVERRVTAKRQIASRKRSRRRVDASSDD